MRGCVMAGETRFVLNGQEISAACLLQVTQAALFRECCVRRRERAAGIHFLAALRALCEEPSECDEWHGDGKPEAPRAQPMRTREVIHINALGQCLRCAITSQHVST